MAKIKTFFGAILSVTVWGAAKAQANSANIEISNLKELDVVIEKVVNVDPNTLTLKEKKGILEELKARGLVTTKSSSSSSDTTGWGTSK